VNQPYQLNCYTPATACPISFGKLAFHKLYLAPGHMSGHKCIAGQWAAPQTAKDPPEISFCHLFAAIKATYLWVQSLNCSVLLGEHTTPKCNIFSIVSADHFVNFLAQFVSTFLHINWNENSICNLEQVF
jgi:hypothetical protein